MISLFQHGGPSHMDLTDPKPELTKFSGTDYPGEVQFSFVNQAQKTSGQSVSVSQTRRMRDRDFRVASSHGGHCG
ncbi:MAG: DUF1501 domain-containing protein [Planctomycetaceae bacterium]